MVKVIQNSFLGGQLDFEMMGRQDYAKYRKGASKLVNFNLLKRGGIEKRCGFDRIVNITSTLGISASSKVRLIPFGYKKNTGFVLLFTPGACHAICTTPGNVYKCWTINPPLEGMFTAERIDEFDYAQCGYKLFIAHNEHKPSCISSTESEIEAAISGASQISPFVWSYIDVSSDRTSYIPTITKASQSRIAPSADSAGGTFTEKYKVSAVFDDIETKPCSEFYNESVIDPTTISTTSGGTLVQRSTSTTASYKTKTSSSSGSSTTTTPEVTNTSIVYSNRVKGTCNGTKYYLPWVESQAIELTIRPVQKDGSYPDHVNVYKKASGYYGLIGTATTNREVEPERTYSMTRIESLSSETISSDPTIRAYDPDTTLDYPFGNSAPAYNAAHRTCFYPDSSSTYPKTIDITFSEELPKTTNVKLFFGKAVCTFTAFHTYTETYIDDTGTEQTRTVTDYSKPTKASFSYKQSETTTIRIHIRYKYDDGGTSATGTLSHDVDVTAGPSVSTVNYEPVATSTKTDYEVFAENYAAEFNSWAASIEATEEQRVAEIDIDDLHFPNTPTGLTAISIRALSSQQFLVLSGVAIQGSYGSSRVTFTDKNITPDNSITPIADDWMPPFSGEGNYPSAVCVYQQRLVWASSKNEPETVWMSAVGDFTDYTEHEIQKDDDAIEFSMPVTRFAQMNHIVEMKRLVAFNSSCEWLIDSSSSQKGITYETIRAMPQSYSGSNARLKPLICNNALVFSERTGQAVRRFSYNIADDGFAGRDISILSNSIFANNQIVDWTYQQHPFSTIWCVLSDGTMASLVLMEEQEIIAWATHEHGNPNGKVKAIATSYAISPSLSDIKSSENEEKYGKASNEEVFAIVLDSSTATPCLWIERMRVESKSSDTIYNSLRMDSVRPVFSYWTENATTGAWTNTHEDPLTDTNLVYINGTTGEQVSRATVAAAIQASIADTTNHSASGYFYEGYTFESRFTSVYPSMNEQYVGGGQFAIKNLTNLNVRLEASSGGKVAAARSDGTAMPIRYDDDREKDCSPVFSNGVATFKNCDSANCRPLGCNNRDGRVTIMQNEPWPFTLLSYEAEYATENERYTVR